MRLRTSFYAAPATELAPRLLGVFLCRRFDDGKVVKARITETEAYYGESDSACHAAHGRTPRTDIMYARGGFAYVYLCYGMHNMLNIVSGKKDFPEAVLIRSVEGAEGPGRLTKRLAVTRDLNRENLVTSKRLWLESDGRTLPFRTAPRVGIGYASPEDQARLWRFIAVSPPSCGGRGATALPPAPEGGTRSRASVLRPA